MNFINETLYYSLQALGNFKIFATSTISSSGTTVEIQGLTIDTSGNVKIAVKSALTYIELENISFKV